MIGDGVAGVLAAPIATGILADWTEPTSPGGGALGGGTLAEICPFATDSVTEATAFRLLVGLHDRILDRAFVAAEHVHAAVHDDLRV